MQFALPDVNDPGDASADDFFRPLPNALRDRMKDAGLKFKLERSMSKFWQRFAQWRKRMKKMIKKKDKRSRSGNYKWRDDDSLFGAPQASQVWSSFIDAALPRWPHGCIHAEHWLRFWGLNATSSSGPRSRAMLFFSGPDAICERLGHHPARLPRRQAWLKVVP